MNAPDAYSVDHQIRALTEIIGTLAEMVTRLSGRVDKLAADVQTRDTMDAEQSAPWISAAPAAAEADDPQAVADNFVAFYNLTYVGVDGGRAKPIPPCWRKHPGLSAEVASLAYTWRNANTGRTANVRDAQYWLHQWRPGFADRMAREWVHADCFDGAHQDEA